MFFKRKTTRVEFNLEKEKIIFTKETDLSIEENVFIFFSSVINVTTKKNFLMICQKKEVTQPFFF